MADSTWTELGFMVAARNVVRSWSSVTPMFDFVGGVMRVRVELGLSGLAVRRIAEELEDKIPAHIALEVVADLPVAREHSDFPERRKLAEYVRDYIDFTAKVRFDGRVAMVKLSTPITKQVADELSAVLLNIWPGTVDVKGTETGRTMSGAVQVGWRNPRPLVMVDLRKAGDQAAQGLADGIEPGLREAIARAVHLDPTTCTDEQILSNVRKAWEREAAHTVAGEVEDLMCRLLEAQVRCQHYEAELGRYRALYKAEHETVNRMAGDAERGKR